MGQPIPFWQRVSRLFRSGNSDHGGVTILAPPSPPAHDPHATRASGPAPWWRPQARRAQTLAAATRLTEVAEALQDHFRRQDQRAAELSGALERVGGVLAQLAENQRAQGEYLRTIAEHTDAAARHAAAVTTTLARVPDALNAQADAIRTVARQFEIAQESDNQLMHSLQQFGRAVDTLGTSGNAQVEALQRLSGAQQRQHEAFGALVQEQHRRYLVIVIVSGVLALLAVGVAVAALMLQR
ncbi:MAG: hypothetical protein AB1716_00735 [Planctomycetota bacterium]